MQLWSSTVAVLCCATTRAWVRNAWFDSGYIFCVNSRRASWTNSQIFYVKVELRILRSILASLPANMAERGSGRARRPRQWHAFYWFCWYFCTSRCVPDVCRHVGMHTLRSVHSRCFGSSIFTRIFGHYFYEPLVLCRVSLSRHVALVDFFGTPRRRVLRCRGLGVAGSPGVWTPR